MKKISYESEAYNSGWLAGHSALVVYLHEGFNESMPKWLVSLIGGKNAIAEALKWKTPYDDEDMAEIIFDPDYDCGETDGYEELLDEVEEAFRVKKIDMPTFLKEMLGEAQQKQPKG